VYPAERMNHVTANALLKTLEEPPGDVRFVLATEAAHQLLPTIRSRCLGHTMAWPRESEAAAWLAQQGVPASDVAALLRAAGGRPEDALAYSRAGVDAKHWSALPKAIARGDVGVVADWAPAQVVDGLLKLCHDLMAVRAGAAPRFFSAADLPQPPPFDALATWSRDLARTFRTVEHPYNAGLLLEALVSQGRSALHSSREIRR
jgi:DNA polymerase-3 subunit delta'